MLAFHRQQHLFPEPRREPTRMHVHSHTHELTLGLSFFLGAVHALEPGHGKTAMFIYLLEGRRSFWHPIVMGISTAIAHSVSLFAIALAVHLAHHLFAGDQHHEETVSAALQWISALLVLFVGGYLMVQAIRGRVVRCCSHHGHEHGQEHAHTHNSCCSHHSNADHESYRHDHDCKLAEPASSQLVQLSVASHLSGSPTLTAIQPAAISQKKVDDQPQRSPKTSLRVTALLGLAVGLLPCPTALAAYFTGLSTGHPATAYLIIGLFAAGIAVSLSAVGTLLQFFGNKLSHRSQRLTSLPWAYIRATVILGVGIIYVVNLAINGI